jgi:hypothetical protein
LEDFQSSVAGWLDLCVNALQHFTAPSHLACHGVLRS